MKTKIDVRSIIAWAIKIGTLAFSLPATYSVAGTVLPAGTPWFWDLTIRVSAIVILDATFLLSWWSLDSQKTDAEQDKLVETIIVIFSYVLIVMISFAHGEGFRGMLFRAPVGLSLGRSVWRTITYSLRRRDSQLDKGMRVTRKVRKARLLAEENMQIADIAHAETLHVSTVTAQQGVQLAHLNARSKAGIDVVDEVDAIYHEQALLAAQNAALPLLEIDGTAVPTSTYTAPMRRKAREQVRQIPNAEDSRAILTEGSAYILQTEDDGSITAVCLVEGCGKKYNGPNSKSASASIRGHLSAHSRQPDLSFIEPVVDTNLPAEVVEDRSTF